MAKNTEIADRIEEIESEYGVEVTVKGGGRGWTAEAVDSDGLSRLTVQADSKMGVLSLLDNSLQEGEADEAEAEGEEIECSDECQSSIAPVCQCKCDGANHGIGTGTRAFVPVVLGDKPCACGCGEITKRRFVAGHDARFATMEAARAAGVTVEEYRAGLKVERNKRAAAKRREKRAAAKVVAAKVEAAVKATPPEAKQPRPGRSSRKGPKALSDLLNIGAGNRGDDLPF